MAYLRSVIDTPQHLRLALSQTAAWDQTDPDDTGFNLEIDEPVGGPIVLRVRGDLDTLTAPILAACLDEVVLCGRSAVLDLLSTGFVGCAALSVLADAGRRLSEQRSRLTVATVGPLRHIICASGIDTVQCFGTVAEAFTAAHTRPASVLELVPPRPMRDRQTPPCSRPVTARRPPIASGDGSTPVKR